MAGIFLLFGVFFSHCHTIILILTLIIMVTHLWKSAIATHQVLCLVANITTFITNIALSIRYIPIFATNITILLIDTAIFILNIVISISYIPIFATNITILLIDIAIFILNIVTFITNMEAIASNKTKYNILNQENYLI
ncbi:MAG: hypothetical protein RMZ41_000325 [Nostoc sp. DedVER02]|uniref:hypothetical protein n=1 Tax=unclassified Nostoc TaxID=2593658 RepID=UPI002AD1E28C|nr:MULTISPECIES: hypothetical protein [unclassified Nostoc]MDZ7987940.1 hypothetical protein [Nostoc sp. DedVER02]MDZ8114864.1 hypothetical protein [Nostoc sp. DedVER01b]